MTDNENTYTYKTVKDVIEKASEAVGHKIGEYNINNRSLTKGHNKGVIGQIMEEGFFHYKINNRPGADFESLGVELKVAGIKKIKNNKFKFKERLVLNVIDYMKEPFLSFYTSSFWLKNKNLLFMLYLYNDVQEDVNFPIVKTFLHNFKENDLLIIKQDYESIINKIISGEAHNISEADTLYLSACTKGSKALKEMRKQPFNSIKAPQRAFCLKKKYLDSLLDENEYESITTIASKKHKNFFEFITNKLNRFKNKTETELRKMFHLDNVKMKNIFPYLIGKMIGLNGSINKSEEFVKSNLMLKVIRVENNGDIKESMSFPHIDFCEIVKEEWDTAKINQLFTNTKFIFAIFKKEKAEYHFEKVVFWSMPYNTIQKYVKPVWKQTINVIKSGKIVKFINENGKHITNFLGSSYNNVCHIRPHDQKSIIKSGKGCKLPVKDKITGLQSYTKQCFWLDSRYIKNIIK